MPSLYRVVVVKGKSRIVWGSHGLTISGKLRNATGGFADGDIPLSGVFTEANEENEERPDLRNDGKNSEGGRGREFLQKVTKITKKNGIL